jgi:hypothetical protein
LACRSRFTPLTARIIHGSAERWEWPNGAWCTSGGWMCVVLHAAIFSQWSDPPRFHGALVNALRVALKPVHAHHIHVTHSLLRSFNAPPHRGHAWLLM